MLGDLEIDPDVLDYIASGVVEEGALLPCADFDDFVMPLIEDMCNGNGSEASALAQALYERLAQASSQPGGGSEKLGQAPARPGGIELRSLCPQEVLPPPSLRSLFPELSGCAGAAAEDTRGEQSTAHAARRAAAKGRAEAKEAKALARQAVKCTADSAQLDAELDAACESAVKLSVSSGRALNAAVNIGPFDLPHPGGCGSLVEDVRFSLTPGRRYALIGRNGKGKSTLLRYLAARRVPGLAAAVRVHYVSQDISFSAADLEKTPAEVLVDADVERRLLLARARSLEADKLQNAEEYRDVLSQLEAIGAHSAEARAVQTLGSLGLGEELQSRRLRALSGGWRVRVALGAALFARPDVLMLDEPTNHLSMQAVLWLSHELSRGQVWRSRAVLVVSHDRFFVDATCTDVLHISGRSHRLTHTRCSYTAWERARREQQTSWQHRSEVRAKDLSRLRRYLSSGQAAAGNTSQGSRRMQIQKLEEEAAREAEELAALEEDTDLPLSLLSAGGLERPALELRGVAFAYPGSKALFRGVGCHPHEFVVTDKSRIVLVGENGNGKSTLVKLLLGELEPTAGEALRNRNARFAVVNQHHADQLDLGLSPLELMRRRFPGDRSDGWERGLQGHLERCGVEPGLLGVPAAALSGGQRSRLAMAVVSFERPHVLIMDEPTNNLDLSSIEALAGAVERFEGGVVLVSHDQHFVQRVAREVWVVDGGAVRPARCGFEEYRAKLLAEVAPGTELAAEALDEYLQRRLVESGGRISRLDLAKEAKALKS